MACLGTGSHLGREGKLVPCNCVLRTVFRACYGRFRECVEKEKYLSRVTLERWPSGKRRYSWGRKDEEYIADFVLLSRRALTGAEYRIFKFHFLLGADWRLCCLRLKVDRGTFFHCIYRIEQKLGHAFRETEPYGLFPLSEYFGDALHDLAIPRRAPARAEALRVTLAEAC